MKILLTYIFSILLFYSARAQLLDGTKDWFEMTHFFNSKQLKENKIRAIHFKITDKADGAIIKDKGNFLHYDFNAEGELLAVYKSIKLSRKVDTAFYRYSYNAKNELYKIYESSDYFAFNYYFFYKDGERMKELKTADLNDQTDTLYTRYYTVKTAESDSTIITLNGARKPFIETKYHYRDDLLASKQIHFLKNQNKIVETYIYNENKQIVSRTAIKNFGSTYDKLWEFNYIDNILDLVNFQKESRLVKKYGFTYRADGLPSAIVERNLVEKSIRIYELLYEFAP